ncbi:thiamine pyrophosphokinase [Rhizodiscina lignyota]|uniref:Thiamine pyrophosphokinase n=1 Tax=Rhizodiscina lignyota TaxID=1504668 RepID=A0A9P4MAF6_9PEZI|nr:thiamine pyrophosphokinase [Rhizodiscina lignyota]
MASNPPASNLDLINECDSFPHPTTSPQAYHAYTTTLYHLRVAAHPETTLGYILPDVAAVLHNLPDWEVDDESIPRTITLISGSNEAARSDVVARTTEAMRMTGHFKVLEKWRNELYPVYGPPSGASKKKELLFSMERCAAPLFGIVTYGVHLTAYTRTTGADGKDEYKIWVPRRARTKQTYGGMLDNTVAGGTATGEGFFESLVRECDEEASLPEELVRSKAKQCGTVTYFYIRNATAGGETGLFQPECQNVYDLELPSDGSVVPKPNDDEVEEFYHWSVSEVREALGKREFKPNCALVILDFLIRHGLITVEDERDYLEITTRLHRRLEFPLA